MKNSNNQKGFTLIELVITMGIVTMVGVLFMRLSRDITDSTLRFSGSLITQAALDQTMQVILPEIRSASQANDGSYPILEAGTSSLQFYSDVTQDGLFDLVRYYLEGSTFKKGVVAPTGSPLAYVTSTEVIRDVVYDVIPGAQLFTYYDKTATSPDSTPLQQPVDVSKVRTIKITLVANQGTTSTPSITGVETQATIRNLRNK
jgi:prepilin-type N-terminal cleavage/methylation domain-containing protein